MKKKMIIFASLFCMMISTVFASGNIVLIVNKDVVVSSVDEKTVKSIFLGKKKKWNSGTRIVPVLIKSGALHDTFLKDVIKMKAKKFNVFWKRMIFTGKATALKSYNTEQQVIKYVSMTSGAIGYVDAASVDAAANPNITILDISGGGDLSFY